MVFCSLSTCLLLVSCFCFPRHAVLAPRPTFTPDFLPTGEDTAQHLFETFATSSQDQQPISVVDVKNALEKTRTRQETKDLGFEDRIIAALSILGISGY